MELHKLLPPIGSYFSQIKPMEPRAAEAPFDSPNHYFQIKWDGVRMVVFLANGRVDLQNRKGHRRTEQYPELQALSELVRAKEAILDGEVVVMEKGKPSFPKVLQRDFLSKVQSIKTGAQSMPCTYCVFDILYLNETDLLSRPLIERLDILSDITQTEGPLYLNENFDSGTGLYTQVDKLELEGIVAKEKDSPYVLGQKSSYWLKIKPRRKLLCVVGGVYMKGGSVGALLLGAWQGKKLLYIGRAGSGLAQRDLITLRDYAIHHAAAAPCFVNPPKGKGNVWLDAQLTVEIEYAEWTSDLRLRAPVVIGFSNRFGEEAIL